MADSKIFGYFQMMKILKLTLHRRWFDDIAAGIKKREYRSIKPHWSSRLLNCDGEFRDYDEVWFTNGYGSTRPFMRVEFLGISYEDYEDERCFSIALGEIFEIRNYVELITNPCRPVQNPIPSY
jgi:hypothetical protein